MYICGVKNIGKIKRIFVWLSRICHCRGFGIQSPWAYNVSRYVINEHWRYYRYAEVEKGLGRLSAVERKLGQLYFRLANFVQPFYFAELGHDKRRAGIIERYVQSGCERCVTVNCSDMASVPVPCDEARAIGKRENNARLILVVDGASADAKEIANLCRNLIIHDYIIIEDIAAEPKAKAAWAELKESLQGVLLFDLYYAGVIFVDPARYKQHYIINF